MIVQVLLLSAVAPALLSCGPAQDLSNDSILSVSQGNTQTPGSQGQGGFPGGPMGMFGGGDRKLVKEFDKDGNGWLNKEERAAARATVKSGGQGGQGGRGGFGGFGRQNREPAKPGLRVRPADVSPAVGKGLYDEGVLRTIFIDFDATDWEAEMADFYHTDVEVPAALTVDGKRLPNVGIAFRGQSSYFSVPAGYKRSLHLSLDLVESDHRLYGVRSLNLLNCSGDPSMLSTVLYSSIARTKIPAPRANFVRVVINGESWGIYVNAEQFNSDFVSHHFKAKTGARWKVDGSPGGDAGLYYLGEDLAGYRSRYTIKSKDREEDWKALVQLCKTLSETPLDKLEVELSPQLDIEGTLWFLALDVALVNSDGYWIRGSDYSLYRDPKGKFHPIPHDMSEAFRNGGGSRGGPGGPPQGGQGAPPGAQGAPPQANRRMGMAFNEGDPTLDPLVGMDNLKRPLRSRLLAVPNLRKRYLAFVKEIAEGQLHWNKLGQQVTRYKKLVEAEILLDTKKLVSNETFLTATSVEAASGTTNAKSLRTFAETRSNFLLDYIKNLPKSGEGTVR